MPHQVFPHRPLVAAEWTEIVALGPQKCQRRSGTVTFTQVLFHAACIEKSVALFALREFTTVDCIPQSNTGCTRVLGIFLYLFDQFVNLLAERALLIKVEGWTNLNDGLRRKRLLILVRVDRLDVIRFVTICTILDVALSKRS